jgi:hypothetical protein
MMYAHPSSSNITGHPLSSRGGSSNSSSSSGGTEEDGGSTRATYAAAAEEEVAAAEHSPRHGGSVEVRRVAELPLEKREPPLGPLHVDPSPPPCCAHPPLARSSLSMISEDLLGGFPSSIHDMPAEAAAAAAAAAAQTNQACTFTFNDPGGTPPADTTACPPAQHVQMPEADCSASLMGAASSAAAMRRDDGEGRASASSVFATFSCGELDLGPLLLPPFDATSSTLQGMAGPSDNSSDGSSFTTIAGSSPPPPCSPCGRATSCGTASMQAPCRAWAAVTATLGAAAGPATAAATAVATTAALSSHGPAPQGSAAVRAGLTRQSAVHHRPPPGCSSRPPGGSPASWQPPSLLQSWS